ncbi:unnamed protein product [Absidia cylindrospora]
MGSHSRQLFFPQWLLILSPFLVRPSILGYWIAEHPRIGNSSVKPFGLSSKLRCLLNSTNHAYSNETRMLCKSIYLHWIFLGLKNIDDLVAETHVIFMETGQIWHTEEKLAEADDQLRVSKKYSQAMNC